jgi:hypothetical protein
MTDAPDQYGNPDRTLIWIPAVPSSGSSCVAGMLRHLGVSMGRTNMGVWLQSRGYEMWEDPDMKYFGATYGPQDGLVRAIVRRRHIRLMDYINYRFIQEPHARVGFKSPATFWINEPEPERLPIEWIDLRRPLEDSIVSDLRRNRKRVERMEHTEMPSVNEEVDRGADVAGCLVAKELLETVIKPKIRLDWYEVVERPREAAEMLNEAFALEATEEQIESAADMVDPKRTSRKVLYWPRTANHSGLVPDYENQT